MVIVEYCRYGNLSTFLKSKREVFVHDVVSLKSTVKDAVLIDTFHIRHKMSHMAHTSPYS